MTVSRTTFVTIGVTALVASTVTLLFSRFERASASAQATYRLRAGDYVSLPSLDWTCSLADGSVEFACSTNDKPISVVAIYPREIVIAARTVVASASPVQEIGRSSAPVGQPHGAYSFAVSHH